MMLSGRNVFCLIILCVLPAASPAPPTSAGPGWSTEGTLNAGSPLAASLSSSLCRSAARNAETRFQLPAGILLAIGQVESARPDLQTHRLEAWPWTVQALGQGLYFNTKTEAIAWVRGAEARGVTSIDAGCLQVNLFFHPRAFASLDEAFDPQRNADYAGLFLRQLYSETGDWRLATGLYHSRTAAISLPYQQRVERALLRGGLAASSGRKPTTILGRLRDAWGSTLTNGNPGQPQAIGDWNATPSSRMYSSSYAVHPVTEHRRLTEYK
jgi:hypothetical protein